MNFVRSPNVVAYWRGRTFVLEEFERRRRISASPLVVQLLERFSRPRNLAAVARTFAPYSPGSVKQQLESLRSFGFLVPVRKGNYPKCLAEAWGDSWPAAYYHFSGRDMPITGDPIEKIRYFRSRLAMHPQPPLYKNYPGSRRIRLPKKAPEPVVALERVLRRRETVRDFRESEIGLPLLASLVRGTWGQTAWLEAGLLGRLLAKTSPSAGARHPIECYVLAFRVRGLSPGLYHYSVQMDSLEQLRVGDFGEETVRLASGQQWVGSCAFVCIMTAVAARSFWKYPASLGYRAMLLDAGHLGQTFSLLATALKLGPFTTGAIQQSQIETLLNLDGITEFPIYLCGAGIPATPRRSLRRARERNDPKRRFSMAKRHLPIDDKTDRR